MVFAFPFDVSQNVIRFCAPADAVRLTLVQRLPEQIHFEILQHCSAYEAFIAYQCHLAEMNDWERIWPLIHQVMDAHFAGEHMRERQRAQRPWGP